MSKTQTAQVTCAWESDGVPFTKHASGTWEFDVDSETFVQTCDRDATIVVHFTDNVYSDSEWDNVFCAEHAAEVLAEDSTLVSAEAVRELV